MHKLYKGKRNNFRNDTYHYWYSWRKKSPFTQGRLDFFLLSVLLLSSVDTWYTESRYRSDHSAISLSLTFNDLKKDEGYGNVIALYFIIDTIVWKASEYPHIIIIIECIGDILFYRLKTVRCPFLQSGQHTQNARWKYFLHY